MKAFFTSWLPPIEWLSSAVPFYWAVYALESANHRLKALEIVSQENLSSFKIEVDICGRDGKMTNSAPIESKFNERAEAFPPPFYVTRHCSLWKVI